jgi:hypothetical protein
MTHSIMRKLNQTFITPFDREDLYKLASSLDDVLDFLNAAGVVVGAADVVVACADRRVCGRGDHALRLPGDHRRGLVQNADLHRGRADHGFDSRLHVRGGDLLAAPRQAAATH